MSTERTTTIDPDDPRKAESPTELPRGSVRMTLKRTLREFSQDQCTDLAAALTYYAVLALFPALIALTALLGLVGQAQSSINTLLDIVEDIGSPETVETVRPVIETIVESETAGLTLVVGLLGALWSASGYVGAFGRAMNRIYEVAEGRPFYKLRPAMVLVTLVTVLLVASALVMLVVSGPVARAIGNAIGLGDTAVLVWNIAKWPALLAIVVLVVALLYYATPNVRQPRFRWLSVGALVAIAVWALGSAAFGFYVANFSSYNSTYGSLAGVIVFLLWLWLTNLALLFGAELDAELERSRELAAGIPAEVAIQLPARDTTGIAKAEEKEEETIREARELRERAAAEKRHDFSVDAHEEHVAGTGESAVVGGRHEDRS